MNIFELLTIVNTTALAILPFVFFRRQKLQEIKYKEIMELNIKVHDITKRADRSVKRKAIIDTKDYERLDYLISRYKKHDDTLSIKIDNYRKLWEKTIEENKLGKIDGKKLKLRISNLLKESEKIRELADKLLK